MEYHRRRLRQSDWGEEIIVVMYQSVVSQPVVLAGNVLCILLMLVSVQYVFHDNQDSVY